MAAGTEYTAGTTGGSNSITLTATHIPSLNITGTTTAQNNIGSTVATKTTAVNGVGSTSSDGAHTHTLSTTYANFNILTVNTGGYGAPAWDPVTSTTSSSGQHTHTLNIPQLTVPTTKLNIPSLVVNAAYTNNSQSSVDVTNKYLAVYMWKRIA